MQIELRRIRHRPETIDGQIRIDGMKVCDCAENAHHCLPTGTYQVSVIKCKQHSRKMPVVCLEGNTTNDSEWSVTGCTKGAAGLQSKESSCLEGSTLSKCDTCPKLSFVSNNTTMPQFCPMITAGNGVYKRTDGSIIVGRYIAPGCLTHPKSAFDALYERIRKNIERGNPVTLTISR